MYFCGFSLWKYQWTNWQGFNTHYINYIKIVDGCGGCVNLLQWTEYAAWVGGDMGEMEISSDWNKHM